MVYNIYSAIPFCPEQYICKMEEGATFSLNVWRLDYYQYVYGMD